MSVPELSTGCLKVSEKESFDNFTYKKHRFSVFSEIFVMKTLQNVISMYFSSQEIMTNDKPYEGEPILQVLGSKRIAGGNAERYRLLLSDGMFLQSFSMLSTQLNHLVVDGQLSEFTIIKVQQHITSVVNKNENDERFVCHEQTVRINNQFHCVIFLHYFISFTVTAVAFSSLLHWKS